MVASRTFLLDPTLVMLRSAFVLREESKFTSGVGMGRIPDIWQIIYFEYPVFDGYTALTG